MKCGLIGEKLGHSYSCEIHSAIAEYDYRLIELPSTALDEFFTERNFDGINVTIPYKESVIKFLDEISPEAERIGAVNTVVNRGGRLVGYNTDYFGIIALFKKAEINPQGKKILILGTGGTAKTASTVLADTGAREIVKVSRTAKGGAITYLQAVENHSDAEIIFNATPVGMFPHDEGMPIDIDKFPAVDGVVDAIYHPLSTNLVLGAKKKGARSIGGLYMLSAQAVYASALFAGEDINSVDDGLVDKAYNAVLRKKRNIVLVGMPASGKSTIGQILARETEKEFVDIDDEIEKSIGSTIAEFFEKYGEDEFRAVEREVTAEISKRDGLIIATGGGCPLFEVNANALRRNGVLVFLDRDLDKLVATSSRPLSSDREKLAKLYMDRYDKYLSVADVTVASNQTPEEVANKIIEECGL